MADDIGSILDGEPVEKPAEPETPQTEEPAAEEVTTEPAEATEDTVETPTEEPVADEPQQSDAEKGLLAELSRLRQEMRDLKAQPAPEPTPLPDVIEDPTGFAQTMQTQVASMVQNERLNMSEAMARQSHGDEKVNAARDALLASGDQAAHQQIMQSAMPYEALIKWHEQQSFFQQVGSDPQAFMNQERERIRAEVMAELQAQQTAKAVKSAPSLAAETSIGGRTSSAAPTLTPLDDILS